MLNPSLIAKAHFAMDRGFLRNASGATALYIHYAYLSAVLSEYEVDGCRYEDALVWARGRSTPGYPTTDTDHTEKPPVLHFPHPEASAIREWLKWYDQAEHSTYPESLTHGQLVRELVALVQTAPAKPMGA